jgi:hypothetical protein
MSSVLSELIGCEDARFRGNEWPPEAMLFRSKAEWFKQVAALDVFHDPERWLDLAPLLHSFLTSSALARSEARRRYRDGESIYIVGLEETVPQLRKLCDGLARDLALAPSSVRVEAWAAEGPTRVRMHFDLDFNFNVQIVGRKTWRTAPNRSVLHPVDSYHVHADKAQGAAEAPAPPAPHELQMREVEPGHVVYLPHVTWHTTETTETTFAMAFVVKPPTWAAHVTHFLRERLHEDPRWRARLIAACNPSHRASLQAVAKEVLAASAHTLAAISPSELLYLAAWGGMAESFERAEDAVDAKLESVEDAGVLRWVRAGQAAQLVVPPWARRAAEFIVDSQRSWSLAALQELTSADDIHFVNAFVLMLVQAGFLRKVRRS